jgi:predicted small metal-binding protein
MIDIPTESIVMKVVHCECGAHVEAETDDELVAKVESHVQERHPELVGQMSREQILGMAHDH